MKALLFIAVLCAGCGSPSRSGNGSLVSEREQKLHAKTAAMYENIKKDIVASVKTSGPETVVVTVKPLYSEYEEDDRQRVANLLLRHYRVSDNRNYTVIEFVDKNGRTLFSQPHSGKP